MIKIVQRQDIEDVITGNIDAVKSVVYYTHLMAPEDGIHPLIKREGDVLRCKLFSNQISELITGNLICQIETAEHDEEYPDREYNETKKINLNIWIKGKDPRDETLRVGYENLTIGLKHAVDKANTSVQPDDLTHYVKIEDFETQISEKVDRADVYVKDEIDTQINTLRGEIPSIDGLATEQWVENKGYLTEHQQLKTINGETITGSGDIKVSGATETWVETQISTKVDRADVYVKSEIDNQINTLRGEIPSLDGIATETWVENKGYLTQHQDLSGYVAKSELETSLQPYATEQWVESKGYLTEHQSLAGFATEQWVESKGYLTEHQSLAGFATETWVENKGYLTSHQDLSGYVSKSELETSLQPYATETWVENKGYLTQHQDISGKLDTNSIWSGTAAEWELVTDKSQYIIALIK